MIIDCESLVVIPGEPMADSVHRAAMYYISQGIPVLPLEPGSKRLPEIGGINYSSASTKPSTVDRWFGKDGKYRGFNIGMGCGAGRVMALDIDAKPINGTTGIKELKKILDKEGPMPSGPVQKTPSGGFHHIFLWQENAASSTSKVANGIDTRGGVADRCTGHIVVFPSVVDGKRYEWMQGGEIPAMPKWLVSKLGSPWKEPKAKGSDVKVIPTGQIERMLATIDPDTLSYDDWIRVGMGLKSCMGDDGFQVWDEWSSDGERRKEGECSARWKSFEEEGSVGLGTLLFLAKDAGWRPMEGDVLYGGNDSAIEERVLEMNKRYALVRMGKTLLVATFENNFENRKVDFLSMQSFRDMSAPEKVFVTTAKGVIEKPMSDIWMASPARRAYNGCGIYPQNDQPQNVLNIWDGWAVEPNPEATCERYMFHLRDTICNGDMSIYTWILDWMADCVQDSRHIKGCCIVLRGVEGCGKGMFADTFGRLFGNHYSHLIDSERLTGKFNSYLSDSIVIYADEVLWPGDRKSANILKGRITETRIHKEHKGVDAVEVDNLARVIIASNEDWIVPAGPQSRRWLVLNVNGSKAGNREYFDGLSDEIKNGGMGALLHFLQNRKITSDLRLAPKTEALLEQRRMSNNHDSMSHWLYEVLLKGSFDAVDVEAMVGDDIKWPRRVRTYELYAEYRDWAKDNRISSYDTLNLSVFSDRVKRYGFVAEGKEVIVPSFKQLESMVAMAQGAG